MPNRSDDQIELLRQELAKFLLESVQRAPEGDSFRKSLAQAVETAVEKALDAEFKARMVYLDGLIERAGSLVGELEFKTGSSPKNELAVTSVRQMMPEVPAPVGEPFGKRSESEGDGRPGFLKHQDKILWGIGIFVAIVVAVIMAKLFIDGSGASRGDANWGAGEGQTSEVEAVPLWSGDEGRMDRASGWDQVMATPLGASPTGSRLLWSEVCDVQAQCSLEQVEASAMDPRDRGYILQAAAQAVRGEITRCQVSPPPPLDGQFGAASLDGLKALQACVSKIRNCTANRGRNDCPPDLQAATLERRDDWEQDARHWLLWEAGR